MDPLGYAMAQLAVRSMRHQFEYEADGELSHTRPASTIHVARRLKRLVAKRRAGGVRSVPVTERC